MISSLLSVEILPKDFLGQLVLKKPRSTTNDTRTKNITKRPSLSLIFLGKLKTKQQNKTTVLCFQCTSYWRNLKNLKCFVDNVLIH